MGKRTSNKLKESGVSLKSVRRVHYRVSKTEERFGPGLIKGQIVLCF